MKILIIQTAFIGDVILATSLVEKLKSAYPAASLHFLLRKGNESLLQGHPHVARVWIWDKSQSKYRHLWDLLRAIRREQFDWVINCQRFSASGLLTGFSGAQARIGFDKNPFSFLFTQKIPHQIGQNVHEVARNHALIAPLTDAQYALPKLYPSAAQRAQALSRVPKGPYCCMAPTSVWFTKQWPKEKWIALCRALPTDMAIVMLGGKGDHAYCQDIMNSADRAGMENRCGEFSLLESAVAMEGAVMNYVNDSAPVHIASAMNAPVTAIFCSTIPEFGFTPLSTNSRVVEISEKLDCRPCGLHGKASCPKGHFKCAFSIEISQVLGQKA